MNMTHMMASDEILARAAADGDRDAFGQLIRRHYDRLYRLGWRLTGNSHDAEDLAHDIMVALPAKLRNFRGEAKFTTWLYRITLNAATDRARKLQRHRRATKSWGEEQHRMADEAQEARAAQDWLVQAMQALPSELRETVALTLGEELTQREAADILGLSEGTIAWRMSEVKRCLRAHAEQEIM